MHRVFGNLCHDGRNVLLDLETMLKHNVDMRLYFVYILSVLPIILSSKSIVVCYLMIHPRIM